MKRFEILLCMIILIISIAVKAETQKTKLAPRFAQFLNDVKYIISQNEKDYFMNLVDQQKDAFITQFWEKLDPEPLTPFNEFKEEYYQRLAHVDKWYERNSERGKIYLLLGKPDSTESFLSQSGMYPMETWDYDNLDVPGLPNSLRLIFFKPYGVQDYRLYSPLFDGLEGLLTNRSLDTRTLNVKMGVWSHISMGLRTAIDSVSPGVNQNSSEIYLLRLSIPMNSLKKEFGRKEKAIVETKIVYNSIAADVVTFAHLNTSKNYVVHLGITIPFEFITYEKYNNNYYSRTDLTIEITDNKNRQVDLINDQINLSFSESQWKGVNGLPVFYTMSYVLLPGSYHYMILVRNFTRNEVGKIEKDVVVPELMSDKVAATDILLGYKIISTKDKTDSGLPFVFPGIKFFPIALPHYSSTQKLLMYLQLYFRDEERPDQAEINYLVTNGTKEIKFFEARMVKDYLVENTMPIYQSMPLNDLRAGNYSLMISIAFDGEQQPSISRKAEFTVSSQEVNFKRIMAESNEKMTPFAVHYNLARQYVIQENWKSAEEHLAIALDFEKNSMEAQLLLTDALLGANKNDEALKMLLLLSEQSKDNPYILMNSGKAYYQKNDYKNALNYFIGAEKNGIHDNYNLKNYIGESYYKLGNNNEALKYFRASLSINSSQPKIAELVNKLSAGK